MFFLNIQDKDMIISVCGAGTMGRGIALLGLLSGNNARIYDVSETTLQNAETYILNQIQKLCMKGKINQEEADRCAKNVLYTNDIAMLVKDADFIIEAIIEYPEPKHDLFVSIENAGLSETTILATNTSSLSVNVLSKNRKYPHRFVGLHFFNPAQIMKLVEIVQASSTSEKTVEECVALCTLLGKSPVIAKDVPGFIVNRVARNYYNESMRIATEQMATPKQIDSIMKSAGFRMGPFELMDLIGNDINLDVTKSVASQYFYEPRFTPSLMQQTVVNAGNYGRKTGSGFYDYNDTL